MVNGHLILTTDSEKATWLCFGLVASSHHSTGSKNTSSKAPGISLQLKDLSYPCIRPASPQLTLIQSKLASIMTHPKFKHSLIVSYTVFLIYHLRVIDHFKGFKDQSAPVSGSNGLLSLENNSVTSIKVTENERLEITLWPSSITPVTLALPLVLPSSPCSSLPVFKLTSGQLFSTDLDSFTLEFPAVMNSLFPVSSLPISFCFPPALSLNPLPSSSGLSEFLTTTVSNYAKLSRVAEALCQFELPTAKGGVFLVFHRSGSAKAAASQKENEAFEEIRQKLGQFVIGVYEYSETKRVVLGIDDDSGRTCFWFFRGSAQIRRVDESESDYRKYIEDFVNKEESQAQGTNFDGVEHEEMLETNEDQREREFSVLNIKGKPLILWQNGVPVSEGTWRFPYLKATVRVAQNQNKFEIK